MFSTNFVKFLKFYNTLLIIYQQLHETIEQILHIITVRRVTHIFQFKEVLSLIFLE